MIVRNILCIEPIEYHFGGKGEWNSGNDFARNVIIFGVDNSSSTQTDNYENNVLTLSEDPTYGINGSFENRSNLIKSNFGKTKTKFCFDLHYSGNNGDSFVSGNNL